MFCKNCGASMPDTAKFCKECGTPVAAESEETAAPAVEETPAEVPHFEPAPDLGPAAEPVAEPESAAEEAPAPESAPAPEGEPAPEPAPKKKSKAKPIIITVAIIVAFLGILAGLLIGLRDTYRDWGGPFPYIANTVDKMFLSEKDYSKKVAENAVSDGMESLKNKLNEVTKAENTEKKQIDLQNMGLTAKAKVEVDEALLALLEQASGVDLSFLKSVELVADVDSASNAAKVALDAKLNGKSIAKLSAIADFENTKAVYLTLPGLSESAVKVALPEEEMAELSAQAEELMKQIEAIDIDAAANLIVSVLDVAMEQLDDYQTEDEKLTVEGVSVNATKVIIKIDGSLIKDVLVAVLEELENNGDLEKFVQSISGIADMDADELYSQMKEDISYTLEQLKELEEDELDLDFDLDINLWVDGKGEIIGMGAELEMDGQKMEFRAVSVVDGKDEAMEIAAEMDMDGQKINVGFSGKGTRENGKLSGDYAVKYDDASLVDFKLENWSNENGYTNGSVTVQLGDGVMELLTKAVTGKTSVSEELTNERTAATEDSVTASSVPTWMNYLMNASLKFTIESSENTSKLAIEVIYNNASFVKLSVELAFRDLDKDFSVKADKTFDIEDGSAMTEFAQTIDLEALMENLENAGVPVDELTSMIGGMMGGMDSDYDYDDYDDYYDEDYDELEFGTGTVISESAA